MDKELLQAQLNVLLAQKALLAVQQPKQIAQMKVQADALDAQIKKIQDDIAKLG
jgi:hypothetical protein